jgi:hypothetical protein
MRDTITIYKSINYSIAIYRLPLIRDDINN